jgi:hypothetical protein
MRILTLLMSYAGILPLYWKFDDQGHWMYTTWTQAAIAWNLRPQAPILTGFSTITAYGMPWVNVEGEVLHQIFPCPCCIEPNLAT